MNALGGPLSKDNTISGTYAEPYGYNHVEVIVIGRLQLKFGISEFLSTDFWKQFFIVKNVSDMLVNGGRRLSIQHSYLLLSKPHIFILQPYIKPDISTFGLVNNDITCVFHIYSAPMRRAFTNVIIISYRSSINLYFHFPERITTFDGYEKDIHLRVCHHYLYGARLL